MRQQLITNYIAFGAILRYVQDVQPDYIIHGKGKVLNNIEKLIDMVEIFELKVTLRTTAFTDLFDIRTELADKEEGSTISKEEANRLTNTVSDLRKTLLPEAEGNVAYIVTDKRIDVNKLLSDVPSLLSPRVFKAIPEIAKYDFEEAGKCIAFERPTAAAFHLLRGTEGVLRYYYCCIIKRGRRATLLWKPMLDQLGARRDSPPKSLLDNLDNIRDSYRNPTQHPEAIYDMDEAQNLFGLCVDVVDKMIKDLKKREATKTKKGKSKSNK